MKKLLIHCLILLGLTGCAASTQELAAVQGFEVNRYLGKWYEIARFDHSFEHNLIEVSAEYKLRDDGKIDVINRGFSLSKNSYQTTKGVAHFVDKADVGDLDVTFFWPFYGGYKILLLDKVAYRYALVTSDSFDYLWILARTPEIDDATYQMLVEKARELGFKTDALIKLTPN